MRWPIRNSLPLFPTWTRERLLFILLIIACKSIEANCSVSTPRTKIFTDQVRKKLVYIERLLLVRPAETLCRLRKGCERHSGVFVNFHRCLGRQSQKALEWRLSF